MDMRARLVATSNLKGHYAEFYALFRPVIEALGNAGYAQRLDANENHWRTIERWLSLLQAAGFEVTKVVEDSFVMRFVDVDAMHNDLLVRVGFLPAWEKIVDEADCPRVFDKVAREQGELRMTVPMVYLETRKL